MKGFNGLHIHNHLGLLNALKIKNGEISRHILRIKTGQVDSSVDEFIDWVFDGQEIVIRDAVLHADHGPSDGIEVTGTIDFLEIPNLPVTLYARADQSGSVSIDMDIHVTGTNPSEDTWKLSDTFPDTPEHLDSPLFYNTHFWVTNQLSSHHPGTGLPLEWGINFISNAKVTGPLAEIAQTMGHDSDLRVSGTVRVPLAEETPLQLLALGGLHRDEIFPWELKEEFEHGLPGLHLKFHLQNQPVKISQRLDFRPDFIQVYIPYDASWALGGRNLSFQAQQAVTGHLISPSGMLINCDIPFEPGSAYLPIIPRIKDLGLYQRTSSQEAFLMNSGREGKAIIRS